MITTPDCLLAFNRFAAMSKELAVHFFPATFGDLIRRHLPGLFNHWFPESIAERCPMPSVMLNVPGVGDVKLFWPLASIVMIAGVLLCFWTGTQTLLRALREGSRARQGLFIWSGSVLWYGCMCIGGFFFHCLHINDIPHIFDVVGTGLASLSVCAGLAAYEGKVDDRSASQRAGWLAACAAFIAIIILSTPLVKELLYLLPAALAVIAGARFIRKHWSKLQGTQPWRWLQVAVVGAVVGGAALPLDKWECIFLGSELSLIFWFFLGSNIAILATHQFAVVAADQKLHFTDDVKRK